MTSQLTLKYDPLTIKHLGVSLYSQLPSVFSEMLSNAYDADSENVNIRLYDDGNDKRVEIEDDGHGMNFDEINQKYLLVGRNRRSETEARKSPKKKRNVIGKKGLGKLSVFGVCTEIEITTVRDGVKNAFVMNLADIEKMSGEYHPEIKNFNTKVDEPSGTKIVLRKIKRKSPFNIENISLSLAKKFTIFDEMSTVIMLNDDKKKVLTNEMKFSDLNVEFKWDFPSAIVESDYTFANKITGQVITSRTPLKDTSMKGIYLVSRGKIVNEPEFYGVRDNDLYHTYLTGYLEIDFIDEFEEDIISTDRHSLIWENDRAAELRQYLQELVKKVGREWKRKRADAKKTVISEGGGKDIAKWAESLPTYEKDLAEKIIDPILVDPTIDTQKSAEIVHAVMDQFENQSFKNYASDLADTVVESELPKIIDLMNQWKTTEAKELSSLAVARIEVIKKFEDMLRGDTKEVPTLHDFLKKFSWLLDPRVLEFKDEVHYSSLLKETYPEEKVEESDRRIDFLCSNTLGGILYVIEIKRSRYKIDAKAIEQAYEYGVFLNDKYASESGFSNVVCYVVGGEKSSNAIFRAKEKSYMRTGEVFVKTYTELLEQSKEFHKEFIEAHKSINEKI